MLSKWALDTHESAPEPGRRCFQHQPFLHTLSCTTKRLGIPHQVESGKPFTANRNLRTDIVVREKVCGTLQTGSTGISPSGWTSPTQTHKQLYTGEEATLIAIDQQLPLPPRIASGKPTLLRDTHPSTREQHTCHFRG